MKKRPNILTIAGFDPTGGAGTLADIKTIEKLKCRGMAVQTANTIQSEDTFLSVNWINEEQILGQLEFIIQHYSFAAVKIGLVPSLSFLNQALDLLDTLGSRPKIIWDPVLSASAGFDFEQDLSEIKACLSRVDWITPNWNEAHKITGEEEVLEACKSLSSLTKVYLKGGHNTDDLGTDYLIENGNIQRFRPRLGNYFEKHGSGCVLSAALASNLAKGYPNKKAILRTKRYIEQFLKSSTSLLGYHYG